MAEVEEEKEVVVQEEGKPVAEKPIEEPASKPTEQDDNGVVTLDVTKKYRSKRNPEREISGDELWAGFGRGERFNALQSDHQKLQTQDAEKDKEIANLRAQVTASTVKEQAAQAIQELGLGGQKPVAEVADEWESEEQVAVGPKITASHIEETVKKTATDFLATLVPEIKEAVLGVGIQQREEQEAQVQRQQTANALRANKVATLKVRYPDADDGDISKLADRIVEYSGHIIQAVDLYGAKNVVDGNNALFDGDEKLMALIKEEGELAAKQTAITTQRERDAELEGLGAGVLPGDSPDENEEERKPSFKKTDVEANREKRLSRAHKMLDRIGLLKNSGM